MKFSEILAKAKAKQESEPCQHDVEEFVMKSVLGVKVLARVCARCFIDLDYLEAEGAPRPVLPDGNLDKGGA